MSEHLEALVRKNIIFVIIVCPVLIFCVIPSFEVMAAESSKTGTLSMKQQHKAMEILDRQWRKVKGAVKRGDFVAASRGIAFMEQRLAPDIARFQPHRNMEKRDQYSHYYETFVQSLRLLQNAVATKDAPRAAPELVKGVEESCKQCHKLFAGDHH